MALFRRSRRRTGIDNDFPMLSTADADWLRAEAVEAFTLAGATRVRVTEGVVATGDGPTTFGLGNLAIRLRSMPRDEWSAEVREHARVMVQSTRRAHPSRSDFESVSLVAQVVSLDHIPEADHGSPADGPFLAAGLVVRAAIEYPDSVATLLNLSDYGGWEQVGARAMNGLRQLAAPQVHRREVQNDEILLLQSDDHFGASRVLVLEDVLDQVGLQHSGLGYLVSMPDRSTLALHRLHSTSPIFGAIPALVPNVPVDHPFRPLSGEVYFRAPGHDALDLITSHTHEGLVIDGGGAFGEIAMKIMENGS